VADERHLQQEDLDQHDVTSEVASEGGSSGDVEVHKDNAPASGSEATETWRRTGQSKTPIVRDETGRRSP
jgi:hypothetical protein